MSDIRLSIVIPHFNSPVKLDELLGSIGQHDDVEVIVTDDNSTKYLDEYEACVAKYSGRGVKFFKNDSGQKNAGAARNVGLSKATGEWLIFSDADDYFVDGWYDAVSANFDKTEYDVIFYKVSDIDSKHDQEGVKKAVLRYNLLCDAVLAGLEHAEDMIRIYHYAPWSKMIRHSLLKANDIHFESIRYSNDLLFSTKVGVCAGKITVCDKPYYFHTTTQGSLSTNRSEEAFCTKQTAYCHRCDYLHNNMDRKRLKAVNNNEGLRRLGIAAKRHYGVRNLFKYYKMYRKNHVPVFTLKPDEITRLKRMLRKAGKNV